MTSLSFMHRMELDNWDQRFARRVIAFQVPELTYWGDLSYRRWPRSPNVNRLHFEALRDFDRKLNDEQIS